MRYSFKLNYLIVCLVIFGALLVNCQQDEQEKLSIKSLRNALYKSEWTQSGEVKLTNGEYREKVVPGSATEIVIKLTDQVAFGELDGKKVAAVILMTNAGGSGTFFDLAIVAEKAGKLIHVATANLGDRVKINVLSIENGEIVIDMIAHGENDPMATPTQQQLLKYVLKGNQLGLISKDTGYTTRTVISDHFLSENSF